MTESGGICLVQLGLPLPSSLLPWGELANDLIYRSRLLQKLPPHVLGLAKIRTPILHFTIVLLRFFRLSMRFSAFFTIPLKRIGPSLVSLERGHNPGYVTSKEHDMEQTTSQIQSDDTQTTPDTADPGASTSGVINETDLARISAGGIEPPLM
jgi:hypothetical protein